MQSQGKGKGSAEEARIYYIYMAVSQNLVGIDHARRTALWLRIQGQHSHSHSRKRKQTH